METKANALYVRHRLISFFRNIDLPGFRRVSLFLPKVLLPKVNLVKAHFLKTQFNAKIWIDPANDNGVEKSLYETGWYERGILKWMEKDLQAGMTFLDVGANIGIHSILAAQRVGENGQVWSFEAHPVTFDVLEKNIIENKLTQVRAFNCGLGSKEETVSFFSNWSINKGASSKYNFENSGEAYEIKILSIDQIVEAQKMEPNLIKIDVEGMECEVLQGAKRTIEQFKPKLLIEFSVDREGVPNSRRDLYELIHSFSNYTLWKLNNGKERTGKLLPILKFEDLPYDDNVFCLPIK